MSFANVRLEGLPATLRALGKIDPELRKAALRNVRSVGEVIRRDARGRIPASPPMSGWQRRSGSSRGGWTWQPGRSRSRINIKVGSGSVKRDEIRLLRIVQSDKMGSIYDIAGRGSSGRTPQGRQMIRNLNRRGRASRTMWPAAEANQGTVEKALEDAIRDMTDTLNRILK